MVKLEKNTLSNIYIFTGKEAFKKKNYMNQLKKLIAGDGNMNYAFYSGKNVNFQDVYDNAVTLPFFSDKRLVIIENTGIFSAAKKKKGSEQEPSEENDDRKDRKDIIVEKLINDLPASTCLAFFEEETNANKKIYKQAISKGQVIACDADKKDAIVLWLARGFGSAGKKIRKSTAELIVDRVGTDYMQLRTEVEKLISYVGDSPEINDADVYAVTSQNIEEKIFDVLDAICAKDTKKATDKYYGLLANRVPPLMILSMLRRQFRILLQIEECISDGMTDREIVSTVRVQDFVAKKNRIYSKYFTQQQVEQILELICDTDKRIKTGLLDEQIGIECLIVQFSGKLDI